MVSQVTRANRRGRCGGNPRREPAVAQPSTLATWRDYMKKSELPSRSLPKLWCDLNARGLSGEPDDDCFYALEREQLAGLQPIVGMRVFIWDWSDSELFVGLEALLERFDDGWRARPVDEIWYEARPDDTFTDIV